MEMRHRIVRFLMAAWLLGGFVFSAEKLTEEQMTAYRTRPAVVLIYSGMFIKVTLGNGQSFSVPNYGSGSGFFINSEGYLVTNGHVVASYVAYMNDKEGSSTKLMNQFIVQKAKEEFQQSQGREPDASELQKAAERWVRINEPSLSDHGTINSIVMSNSETLRFEVKKYSPSVPEGGKDIAILKVERENCPVIQLGDSSHLVLQQPVFTIGFPAVVDPGRFPLLVKENSLRSAITRGAISALKTDYKGMSVIQHDSATSPGNSGGPTVTADGKVIGVHSYSATQADGFKFCVPINAAKEFIRDAGVAYNQVSEFTTVHDKLLKSVWEERWFDAQTEVSTALAYMKNEPDLEQLQRQILQKISEMGFLEKMWLQNRMVIIVAILLVMAIIFVLWISLRPVQMGQMGGGAGGGGVMIPEPVRSAPREESPEERTRFQDEDGTRFEEDMKGTLLVSHRGEELGVWSLSSMPMILGRDSSCAIVIGNDLVSKKHLRIQARGDQFLIVDLGSTNGTFVNGQKVTEVLVNPSDVVTLGKRGDLVLTFRP